MQQIRVKNYYYKNIIKYITLAVRERDSNKGSKNQERRNAKKRAIEKKRRRMRKRTRMRKTIDIPRVRVTVGSTMVKLDVAIYRP